MTSCGQVCISFNEVRDQLTPEVLDAMPDRLWLRLLGSHY
jgi:hypothetical protein